LSSTKEYEVVFQPFGTRVKVRENATIMDAARALLIDVSTICGERGTCGKCKVRVDEGIETLGPLKPAENRHLSSDQIEAGYRLACVCKVRGDMVITVPDMSRQGKQRLQTEGKEVPVTVNPFIKKYYIEMRRASLEDPQGDDERILHVLQDRYGLDPMKLNFSFDALKNLSYLLRTKGWKVTIVIWNDTDIIAVEPGDTTSRTYGFAVDIGSTKLAGFLMDLQTGKVLSVSARMNPQIPFGDEVMSRLTYAMESKEHLLQLQNLLFGALNEMLDECCRAANVQANEIYEVALVGNSSMSHLFLGLNPKNVGFAPYAPAYTRGLNLRSSALPRLNIHPQANIYLSAIMGGQIGGDSVADVMVARLLESDELVFDIDIGTNTQIAIGNKDGVWMCSTPSGPAFEGMQIKHGMRAASGAIEKVTIDPYTLEVWYRTIDDVKPIGICGSGLIDIPAELLKAGIMDTTGKFNLSALKDKRMIKQDRLRVGPDGVPEFVIAPKEESGLEGPVVITENDIRELAKAKAAMRTGATIIMNRMKITEKDLAKVVIAGAFGNYVDPESARTIGMYPEVPIEKVYFVGNSAGTGARMMLISKEARKYGEEIARKVQRIELALESSFPVEFARAMHFPHMDMNRYPITRDLLTKLGRLKPQEIPPIKK